MLALENLYKSKGKSLDSPESVVSLLGRGFLELCIQRRLADKWSRTPHSLNRSLSNLPEFQQAFGCKLGQPMVHAPAYRVWGNQGSRAAWFGPPVNSTAQVRKMMIAGLPTGVYWPVGISLRPSSPMRNDAMASLRWLHEYRKLPLGSIPKLRG